MDENIEAPKICPCCTRPIDKHHYLIGCDVTDLAFLGSGIFLRISNCFLGFPLFFKYMKFCLYISLF